MTSPRSPGPSSPAAFNSRAGLWTRESWSRAAKDPRAVVWGIGMAVGGWLPASALGGTLWETQAGFLAGTAVLLTWAACVWLGLSFGVWLVRRGR